MFCAEMFRLASIRIQQPPAMKSTAQSHTRDDVEPSANKVSAKVMLAKAMSALVEPRRRRSPGRIHELKNAPRPKLASMTPYPMGPNGFAFNGSRAHNALAKRVKRPVRMRTAFTCGEVRRCRQPSPMQYSKRLSGMGSLCGFDFQPRRKRITPKNESPLTAKAAGGPASAITSP